MHNLTVHLEEHRLGESGYINEWIWVWAIRNIQRNQRERVTLLLIDTPVMWTPDL